MFVANFVIFSRSTWTSGSIFNFCAGQVPTFQFLPEITATAEVMTIAEGNRHSSIIPPKGSWEEQLCSSVGTDLWKNLTDPNNKCIHLYKSVARWNDSAAKEAFDNAKTRFLAKIKELPCNVPSPDPEAYIGEIDWSDSGNPEVVLEEEESCEGDEWVVEGFEVVDPSFCVGVGWGPEEWYEEKKEVNKGTDEERACWEAYWEAKQKAGYNSSTRRCKPRNGYQWRQRNMYV